MHWRVPSARTVYTGMAFAVLAGGVSIGAYQSIYYARTLGEVFIAAAVFCAAIKLLVPLFPGWYRSLALILIFCVAIVFDLLGAVGHGAVTRGRALEEYQTAIRVHGTAAKDVARLERELAAIVLPDAPEQPSAEIEATLDRLRAKLKCRNDESRWCVDDLTPVKTALARAQRTEGVRRSGLDLQETTRATLAIARAKLEAHPLPDFSPDPQATQIAGATGMSVFLASQLPTLLIVALSELGVIAGATLIVHARNLASYVSAPRMPTAPLPSSPRAPGSSPAPGRPRPASDVILDELRRIADGSVIAPSVAASNGSVAGSQRALAIACGVTQPTIKRHLAALAAAGRVEVAADGKVTTVRLL